MSEQELEPEVTEQVEQTEERKTEKPAGTEKLDFAELPDDVRDKFEARFKRVYGHMKEYERGYQTLVQDQKALIQKLEKIENGQIQDRTQRRIEGLNAKAEAAIEAGDVEQAKQIHAQLTEFVNQSIEEARKPKAQPASQEEVYIPPETQAAVLEWLSETDDTGNFKRSWAQASHPKYEEAMLVAHSVYERMRGEPIGQILAAVERSVTAELFPKKPARTQTVLDADQGITPKTDKGVKLSDAQKQVARMMFSDRSPEEAEKAYAQALKEV